MNLNCPTLWSPTDWPMVCHWQDRERDNQNELVDKTHSPRWYSIILNPCWSTGMSVSELPYEMYPFYRLFSTITTFAVMYVCSSYLFSSFFLTFTLHFLFPSEITKSAKKGWQVRCLVTRSGIVYYEYSNIIATVPRLSSEDEYKEAKFEDWLKVMAGAGRPDDWVCPLFSVFLFPICRTFHCPLQFPYWHMRE